jgi:mono/diheme cytochrome c family protein
MSIQVTGSGKPPPRRDAQAAAVSPGQALFAAACAGCHAAPAPMMRLAQRPGLDRSSAVQGASPVNFVQTVLNGIPWQPSSPLYMPPFADTLSDEQVAQLAAYVRSGIASREGWKDVATISAKLRKETQP